MKELNDTGKKKIIEKMRKHIAGIVDCMFCSRLAQPPFSARPMVTLMADTDGTLWFFSKEKSNKNTEIEGYPRVELIYFDAKTGQYLDVYGKAEIIVDSERAAILWNERMYNWFEEGPGDPSLTIIKVAPIWEKWNGGEVWLMAEEELHMQVPQSAAAVGETAEGVVIGPTAPN